VGVGGAVGGRVGEVVVLEDWVGLEGLEGVVVFDSLAGCSVGGSAFGGVRGGCGCSMS
jgi:hypothetical protein